jgi:hypothetical protein
MRVCGLEPFDRDFLWVSGRRIRARCRESGLLKCMTDSDRRTYQVYCAMTGQGETFDTAEGAAAAFHAAKAEDRPCVIYGEDRAAQVLARTMIIGDELVKSLPVETAPRFTAAYLAVSGKARTP